MGHPGWGFRGVTSPPSPPFDGPVTGILPPGGPRSLLLVMMSAVGDAVQVLPVLTAIKRRFPNTRISWLIQPGPYELVRSHPAVDEFILFRRGPRGLAPKALFHGADSIRRTARTLREAGHRQPGGAFDLLLDLQVYFKAGLLTALAPARIKVGFDWRRTRDLNGLFTTHWIPPNPRGFAHTQSQYFEFLRYLGIEPEPLEYGISLSPEERAAQREFFEPLDRPVVSLVLASSHRRKDWPAEKYTELVRRLHHVFDLQPVLVGGESAGEREAARTVLSSTNVPVVDARGHDLRRLLWLLDGSALVVSPDTGPLHMARALETPVVGLYGYTNPKRSGPYRLYEELVVDGYARYPGEAYPLDMKRRRGGMSRISVEMVEEKVGVALDRYVGLKG